MTTLNVFYCYIYKNKDGTPYYVGKGRDNRAYFKREEEVQPPEDRTRICFVCEGVSETEAFEMEVALISLLGRRDLGTGILRNKTNGGDGISGYKHSPRSEDHKRKISLKMTGRKHNQGAKNRMRKTTERQQIEVLKGRKRGETIASLALKFKLGRTTISRICRGECDPKSKPPRKRKTSDIT